MIKYTLYGNNQANLITQINQLDPTVRHVCTIAEFKSTRSTEQNSRYWKLITGLGKHIGYEADEMHDICRFKFLRNAIEIEGERLPLLKSTTKLNTVEMVDYQDAIERWAATMGFIFDENT